MPTFPLGYWTARAHAANTPLRASLNRSTPTRPVKVNWIVTAGDELTLRGIPAIGRGVQGAIRHTRPDSIR